MQLPSQGIMLGSVRVIYILSKTLVLRMIILDGTGDVWYGPQVIRQPLLFKKYDLMQSTFMHPGE